MTDVYILITLAVMWVTFLIIFLWMRILSKTLEHIQSGIHTMKEVLWHMEQLLSVANADGRKLVSDGTKASALRETYR